MRSIINTNRFGLITGMLLPVIAFFIVFLVLPHDENLAGFFREVVWRGVITHVLSLCVIPNLLLFFVFIWTEQLLAARGVLMATVILSLAILAMKWIR